MLTLLSILAMLVLLTVSVVSAVSARRRGNRALEQSLAEGPARRTCERCGSAEVEISGSGIWCHRYGVGA